MVTRNGGKCRKEATMGGRVTRAVEGFGCRTRIAVGDTQKAIRALLLQHGATGIECMQRDGHAVVWFELGGQHIEHRARLPELGDFATFRDGRSRCASDAERCFLQAMRSRWRALLLILRAKFEAIRAGVSSFTVEFLPAVRVPQLGCTVGEAVERGERLPKLPQVAVPSSSAPKQRRSIRGRTVLAAE